MPQSVNINNHIELRRSDDGSLDEIVYLDPNGDCVFHLEQMDDHWFWGRFYSTRLLPLEQDVVLAFGANVEDGEVVTKVTYELEQPSDPSRPPHPDTQRPDYKDGLLKIILAGMVRSHGLEAVERAFKALRGG